jgi:hypothetical protein
MMICEKEHNALSTVRLVFVNWNPELYNLVWNKFLG